MALNVSNIIFRYGKFFIKTNKSIENIEWNSGKHQIISLDVTKDDIHGPLKRFVKDNVIKVDIKIVSYFDVNTTKVFIKIYSLDITSIAGGKKRPALHKAAKILNHLGVTGYTLDAVKSNNMDQ